MKLTPLQRIGVARRIVKGKAPYWRAVMLGMVPVEAPGLGTMAVTENFTLFYDPCVFDVWDDEEVAFALAHELYHPLMQHFRRGMGHPREKANIAADLATNPTIQAMGMKAPPKILFPEMYGFQRGLPMEAYLRLLPDNVQDPDRDPRTGGDPEKGGPSRNGKPLPGTCRGKCGSGAGNPTPGEPQEPKNTRTKAEAESIRKQVARDVQKAAEKGRGDVPSDLVRWAEQALLPPKIRWQDRLTRTARLAVQRRPGASARTYRKVARRQAGIGFGPGRPVIPALYSPRPNIAILTDTSGSMGEKELVRAMSEGKAIFDTLRASVLYATCDAKTQGVKRVRDWKEAVKMLRGGGGTNLRPAFADLLKQKPRPEVIVCFTDGCVGDGIPQTPPPGVRVIFVLVGPYKRKPCEWGEHIFVENDENENG